MKSREVLRAGPIPPLSERSNASQRRSQGSKAFVIQGVFLSLRRFSNHWLTPTSTRVTGPQPTTTTCGASPSRHHKPTATSRAIKAI